MRSKESKFIWLIGLVMVFGLIFAGCEAFQDTEPGTDPDAHGVRVTVKLPDDLINKQGDLQPLTIEENIDVTEVEINLLKNNEVIDTETIDSPEPIDAADYEYEVTFTDVEAGDYEVEAKIWGEVENDEIKVRYEGTSEEFTVLPDEIVEVEVKVDPLDWASLKVELDEETEGVLDRVEKIKLWHPGEEIEAEKTWGNNSVTFDGEVSNLEDGKRFPAWWHLAIGFTEEVEEVNYVDRDDEWIEIMLLPNEAKEIELIVKEIGGKVEVDIIVHQSPAAPVELRTDDGFLEWDDPNDPEADHFTILRDSQDYDGYLEPVAETSENKYSLAELGVGDYYVRAYRNGYSSGIQDEPISIPGENQVYYDGQIYSTIQGAIDAAGENNPNPGTVYVGPGNYDEDTINVHIEGLTLKSLEKQKATILGQVLFNADYVTLDGFVINYDGDDVPVDISVNSPTVINNEVFGGSPTAGIQSYYGFSSGDIVIKGNIVNDGPIGVWSGAAEPNLTIKGNEINGAGDEGIWTYGGNETIIIKGNIVNNAGLKDVKIVDKPVSVNGEISPHGMIMATLRENEGVESVYAEWMGQTGTQKEMGEYIVYDSGRSEYNENEGRPYIEYEVDGADIHLTFNNPTSLAFVFDHRIDFEEGSGHDWDDILIEEGELDGEYIGEWYNNVTVINDTHDVTVSGDQEVWTGMRVGAEQNWYLGWIIFERK